MMILLQVVDGPFLRPEAARLPPPSSLPSMATSDVDIPQAESAVCGAPVPAKCRHLEESSSSPVQSL